MTCSLDSHPLLHLRSGFGVALSVLALATSHVSAFLTGAASISAAAYKSESLLSSYSSTTTCVVLKGVGNRYSRDHRRGTYPTAELRWDSTLASTSEGAVVTEDDAEGGDVSNILDSRSSSSSSGGGSEPTTTTTTSTWATAELPLSNDQQVIQATSAVWKALEDGKPRQILRLSLPLIGATEMDDWPGGDRQRYKACGPMVEKILRGSPAVEGAQVVEQILDESDAVGLMQLQCKEAKDDASAMIFPTTDTLSLQQQVTSGAGSRLVALVNPAWRSTSDFGFFGAGEAKEALSEFDVTYYLQSLVVYGYTLRLLYCYPGPWRLFLVEEDTGTRELVGSWERFPPNEEVEEAVFAKKGRPSATERVRASSKMFQSGM